MLMKVKKVNKHPPPPPHPTKEIHRIGPIDLKIYSLQRNPWELTKSRDFRQNYRCDFHLWSVWLHYYIWHSNGHSCYHLHIHASVADPGCLSRILILYHPVPDPRSKNSKEEEWNKTCLLFFRKKPITRPDPRVKKHRIRIRNTDTYQTVPIWFDSQLSPRHLIHSFRTVWCPRMEIGCHIHYTSPFFQQEPEL